MILSNNDNNIKAIKDIINTHIKKNKINDSYLGYYKEFINDILSVYKSTSEERVTLNQLYAYLKDTYPDQISNIYDESNHKSPLDPTVKIIIKSLIRIYLTETRRMV